MAFLLECYLLHRRDRELLILFTRWNSLDGQRIMHVRQEYWFSPSQFTDRVREDFDSRVTGAICQATLPLSEWGGRGGIGY